MIRRVLAGALIGSVTVVVVLVVAVYSLSGRRLRATYDVSVVEIQTTGDSSTLAWGRHVAEIRGCTDCHREDLGGRTFIDGMPLARLTATNLTSGANGVASGYSDADWVRSIRSGVRPNGLPLLFMPSHEYRPMGPEDLGALVSWIKSMPPVDTDPVEQKIGLLGRVLFLAGQLPLIPAERIDHSDPSFSQPEADVTVVYGAYLATACAGCHGEGFSGGVIPGVPPEWPEAANLTPDVDTGVGLWSEDDFFSFFEDGVRPDGRQVDAAFMPWPIGQSFTDDEKRALWMFLRSLPATSKGD